VRHVREVLDPDGHDHLAGGQPFPGGQGYAEAAIAPGEAGDQHLLDG